MTTKPTITQEDRDEVERLRCGSPFPSAHGIAVQLAAALREERERNAVIWVLTSEYNDYDQYGEYFVSAFREEPSAQELGKHGVPQNRWRHVLNGGGRVGIEDVWFHLRKILIASTAHLEATELALACEQDEVSMRTGERDEARARLTAAEKAHAETRKALEEALNRVLDYSNDPGLVRWASEALARQAQRREGE